MACLFILHKIKFYHGLLLVHGYTQKNIKKIVDVKNIKGSLDSENFKYFGDVVSSHT